MSEPVASRPPARTAPRGWRFIALAELGLNAPRVYLAALLAIVLPPLLLAVMLGIVDAALAIVTRGPPQSTGPLFALVEQYGPIILAGAAVIYAVRHIHRRPWRSLVAPDLRIDPRRLAIGFAVELAILAGQLALVQALTGWEWRIAAPAALPLFVVALVMIPLQAASEELLFRGYLTQALGRAIRSRLAIALLVGAVFGLLHLNAYGPLTVPYFLVVSLIFSLVSLRDERLELAIGGHAAMNLFAFAGASVIVLEPAAIGGGQAALPFNWAAILVLLVNGALFYGLTRLLVRLLAR